MGSFFNDGVKEETEGDGSLRFFVHAKAHLGEILLNRANRMNSFTIAMFATLKKKLEEWEKREDIQVILWRGEHGAEGRTKAFCSGGDVREVAQNSEGIAPFVGPEYQLDHYISVYPKVQLCIWDGILMGAGYGLTGNATIRIATENLQFAMPESRFGLFADIGAAHLMTKQLPKYLGRYLALTADRMKGEEAVWAGLATHYVPSTKLPVLYSTIMRNLEKLFNNATGTGITEPLPDGAASVTRTQLFSLLRMICYNVGLSENPLPEKRYVTPADPSTGRGVAPRPQFRLEKLYSTISQAFSLDSPQDIYHYLVEQSKQPNLTPELVEWYKFAIYALETDCCPSSNVVAFELFKLAETGLTYAENLILDYRIAVRMRSRSDIVAGAISILTKSGRPEWTPSKLDDIPADFVPTMFERLDKKPEGKFNQELEIPTQHLSISYAMEDS